MAINIKYSYKFPVLNPCKDDASYSFEADIGSWIIVLHATNGARSIFEAMVRDLNSARDAQQYIFVIFNDLGEHTIIFI